MKLHSLLERLEDFDAQHKTDSVDLESVGLMLLPEPERRLLPGTQRHAVVFAETGGDSVHFCILEVPDRVLEDSPVVMVVPCCPENSLYVVGGNILDFLALGSVAGYFHLEQLVYEFDEWVDLLNDREGFERAIHFGNEPDPEYIESSFSERNFLAAMSIEFDLRPWPSVRQRLTELNERWSPWLQCRESDTN